MSWSRWVSYFTASAALLLFGCKSAPAVQIFGESTRLARDVRSPTQSAIFDGRELELRGVRGETLGVSVRFSDGRQRSVRLEVPSDVAKVESFRVGYLEVREPSTSMYGRSLGKGSYPDVLIPVEQPVVADDHVYFDLAISPKAAPARYRGTLELGARSVPVRLVVDHARVDLSNDPLVWAFYLPEELARAHGLPPVDGPRLLAIEREYHRLMRAHGVLLAADLRPERFPMRRGFAERTRYWPVALDLSSDASIRRDVRRWLELFAGQTATPFTIPVDEPRSLAEKRRARHIAETIGHAGGGSPRLLRAVTDEALPLYGGAFDVFISPKAVPRGEGSQRVHSARLWTYNGRPPQAGSMILDTHGVALRTWGWIAYRYGVELWYVWEAAYYSDRYNHGGPTDVLSDAITFDERSRGGQDFGNGDGVLVYPGARPSLRLKALRRGLTDRLLLLQLEECGGGEQARRIAHSVVPRALAEAGNESAWSHRETDWERARIEILKAIEVRCHARARLD